MKRSQSASARRVINGGLSLIAMSCGALVTPPLEAVAQATASEGGTDVIVVTARRREEELKDVPIAATVLTGEQLLERGNISDIGSLLATVPAVKFNNLGSPIQSEISIRGSGNTRGSSADTGVGMFRNGMFIMGGAGFGRNFARIDTFDLGQAQILRGSQSALYGRNAIGGVANLISAQPEMRREGRVSLDYGINIDSRDVQIIANEPITENMAVRVSVDRFAQDAGFIISRGTHDGEYVDAGDGLILRGQVRYADGPWDVNLLLEDQEIDGFNLSTSSNIAPGGAAGYLAGYFPSRWERTYNHFPTQGQDISAGILTISHEFSSGVLTSISGIRDRHTQQTNDSDGFDAAELARVIAMGNPLPASARDINRVSMFDESTIILYENLTYAANPAGRFTWLVGVDLLNINSKETNHSLVTPTTANPTGTTRTHTPVFDYFSYAPYGSIGFDVTDAFNITVEARYSHDEKEIVTYQYRLDQTPTAPTTAATFETDNWSYNLVGTYHFTPNIMAYAKAATAYRPGGFNTPGTPSPPAPRPTPLDFGNETSESYEVGLKARLAPWIYAEGAVFRTIYDNMLSRADNGCNSTIPGCTALPGQFVTNSGTGESTGVELSAFTEFDVLGGELRFDTAGAWQEGEIKDGAFAGNRIPQQPDWMASFNANYTRPFIGDSEFFFNLTYQGQWGGTQETDRAVPALPDREIFDYRLGFRVNGWEAAYYQNNAGDSVYPNFISPALTSTRWGSRRVYGVQLRARY